MKIGIDTFACDGGKSGVGVYLTQILKRIPPSGASFELFGWGFDRFAFSEAAPNLEFIPQCFINGRTANALWHIFSYPQFAKKRNYGACFFPAAHRQLPLASPCPGIGVVHDIASYWGARKNREHLGAVIRMSLPKAVRRLDRIIAVSEWVKQELIEFAGLKESRIEVILNGVDTSVFFQRLRNDQSVILIQPFSFRRPYILYVSRIDHPVKNHVKLIEAFAIFKDRTHYPHRLVLAGSNNYRAEKVQQAAHASRYRGDIFFTGYFPSKNLPELYAGADIVVIPSLYEGSGMGILEAMASGIPVACARTASLPEVAGDAALYFDPRNAEEMADRMVTLTANHDIYRERRRLGLERARLFSWDACVERTLQIIQEIADK
jgi:glycosyltransferase involved in cell wall biosynthesis